MRSFVGFLPHIGKPARPVRRIRKVWSAAGTSWYTVPTGSSLVRAKVAYTAPSRVAVPSDRTVMSRRGPSPAPREEPRTTGAGAPGGGAARGSPPGGAAPGGGA